MSSPDMEVFVEDTSGNGTLVNGMTLLRKNERRRLHTGDVISLLNPKLLSKKLRSSAEQKMYVDHYSYFFVNLYEQEARHHGWGIMNSGRRTKGGRRTGAAAVNARAMKCHSINNNNNSSDNDNNCINGERNLFSSSMMMMKGGEKKTVQQQNQRQLQSSSAAGGEDEGASNRRIEEEYDLRDVLGTGTCGEVRRAIHRRTGEERAVKIISIDGRRGVPGMSSEKLMAMQAEAEILFSLDHPYVVKLYDAFISPGKAIYLVMELIRGGDLFDRIVERERYTEVQARRLFRRILAAVHYLHEDRGIVHRDLKPENILVVDRRSDVNIKLTDFGLAKNMTAEGLKTFCGSKSFELSTTWHSHSLLLLSPVKLFINEIIAPQYFAPEVLRRRHTIKGDGRYGKEIDCWSIGVILFILLSGSPPFDVSAGFDAVASATVVFLEDQWNSVSREARDMVTRLLEKDPRRRMSVKDACVHAWILVEDGDTHNHPLHDPLIARDGAEVKVNKSSKDGQGKDVGNTKTSTNPPASPWQKICPPVDASKEERRPSLWSTLDNDNTSTKAIQQACHTSRSSPNNGSPIQKRQLFDEPPPAAANRDSICKRMSKRGRESIMAAGKTLPAPVIAGESRLVKKAEARKKKVQSTLFPSTNASEEQIKIAKKVDQGVSRKADTSTVTPPGTEQNNSVFRLNKKQKFGVKYISPETRLNNATDAKSVKAPTVEKAELSEDELQSDFSDHDDDDRIPAACGNSLRNSENNPLDKYLQKKKMESIDSIASVEIGGKPKITPRDGESRPVSKSTADDNLKAENAIVAEVKPKSEERKLVQTCLFGKPPLHNEVTVDIAAVFPASAEEGLNIGRTLARDEKNDLRRLSAGESIGSGSGVTTAALKGGQRSITSWLKNRR